MDALHQKVGTEGYNRFGRQGYPREGLREDSWNLTRLKPA
jgi:hypothetical protein